MSTDHDDVDGHELRYRDEALVDCQCGQRFSVPQSLRGGLANCPKCRRATRVPGGPEPLFWVLLSGGIALALILTAFFTSALGGAAGLITFAVCALIILVIVLAS